MPGVSDGYHCNATDHPSARDVAFLLLRFHCLLPPKKVGYAPLLPLCLLALLWDVLILHGLNNCLEEFDNVMGVRLRRTTAKVPVILR